MPIKIFVGTSAKSEDLEAELNYEYTLRKHCDHPIEITWMKQSDDRTSPFFGWNTKTWQTPFTPFRWLVPYLCNFKGRAIYTDVDMLNLHDISDLWNTDMAEFPILARYIDEIKKRETSVMLMDCEKMAPLMPYLDWLKADEYAHRKMVFRIKEHFGPLDPRWNCLDGENLRVDEIWQLHYTMISSQPWKPSWYKGEVTNHNRPELTQLWFDIQNERTQYD